MDDCSNCGVDNMPFCEFEGYRCKSILVDWKWFALEETLSKKGKPLKKLTL